MFILPLLTLGCQPAPELPEATFTPESDWIWDNPWPNDRFLSEDGTPDLSNFPNPHNIPLLDSYLTLGERQSGFGNNSGITFPISAPLGAERLPTPEESLGEESTLLLVDVDPTSPYWGERFPVQWHWESDGSLYIGPNVLTIAPVYGFPLRPSTTYAAILTTELVARPATFGDALTNDPRYAGLERAMEWQGRTIDEIGIATVFTTQDPVSEMASIAAFLQDRLASPDLNLELLERYTRNHFTAYRTHYPSPVFTHGTRPYTTSGGEFRFSEDGTPEISHWDDMRLQVCAPKDLSNPPRGGWPVVIYQHGTGGEYDTFCNGNSWLESGARIVAQGAIGLGIDQTLHGTRSGDYDDAMTGGSWPKNPGDASDLAHFNIVNPAAARANFRQGGLDAIYLAAALTREQVVMRTRDGQEIPLNPEQISFLGHSQGGLTGALAAPWLARDTKGIVLSGAGGVLAVTVVKRKDPLDFSELVRGILLFQEDEELHTLHPIISLVQWLVDPTDPVNYAPYWHSEPGWWDGTPAHVLLTSGTRDHATDYETAIAMAAAARMPVLYPRASRTDALELRGLEPVYGPVQFNVEAFDGTSATSALSQWVDGSHWVISEEGDAARMYQEFLRTAHLGTPTIHRDLEGPGQ